MYTHSRTFEIFSDFRIGLALVTQLSGAIFPYWGLVWLLKTTRCMLDVGEISSRYIKKTPSRRISAGIRLLFCVSVLLMRCFVFPRWEFSLPPAFRYLN